MLSASSMSSSSSSAFSTTQGVSTPSSQYSSDSRKGNPLTELIETEQSYMETLKIIDSQIASIWMKQMTAAAPDFSELLRYIHDILKVNKRFCVKLTRIAANPSAISELGDVLMQWVDDLEVPYANFCRSYIPNLNQRQDILGNASISTLLNNLSANASYGINLESLFNAPIQQLKYYKGLYSRLLEGTDSGRADHKLLSKANKRIDMIMAMAQSSAPQNKQRSPTRADTHLPHIQTSFQQTSELTTFESQVDCSRVVDLYGGSQINYQLRISNPGTELVMRDSFIMLPSDNNGGPSIRVHLLLTTEVLVICRELNQQQFLLLYPAIPIGDITVKAESLDRELVGEYIVRFTMMGKKNIIVRADSKEIRNTWIGVDKDAPNNLVTAPRTLSVAAQKKMLSRSNHGNHAMTIDTGIQIEKPMKSKNTRNTDIFTFYSESGGVSPLESSDEEDNNPLFKAHTEQQKQRQQQQQTKAGGGKSRDTIMDIYDNHLYDFDDTEETKFPPVPTKQELSSVTPQSVKILPHVPNVAQAQQQIATPKKDNFNVNNTLPPVPPFKQQQGGQPVKDSSHVQMTYIQAPTSQMATMSISSNNENISPSLPSSSIQQNIPSPVSSRNMNDTKPSSPRAIEVQRAVIPEVMQAVTQKTDEYISDKNRQPQMAAIPRTSSIRTGPAPVNVNQRMQPQYNQPPPPQRGAPSLQQQHNGQPRSPVQAQFMGNTQQRPPMMQQQQNGYQGQQHRQGPPQGYNNGMQSPPPQQQQFRQGPPQGYNNARPMPSPTLSPNMSNNTGRRPPNGPPHGLQQPPGRFNSPSPSMSHLHANGSSMEDLSSPPHSPNPYNSGNDVRQILYSNSQCDVFHWHNQSWYAAEGQCLLQVRVTHTNRACVAVQLQNTGQLYLNAWILPTTVIRTPSATDVSISVYMGVKKENYLIHFEHPSDASVCADILHKVHADSQYQLQQQPMMREQPEVEEVEPVDIVNVPQTLKPVMQCKAKLFIKNETSNWSTFGGVTMRISQQSPSMRMLIQIENDKTKLVSAVVRSGNVEMISSKRISFLLVDEAQKTSIVYMIHLREDQTGNKIYEYLRTKNAENGW